jgi:hypothetical protein
MSRFSADNRSVSVSYPQELPNEPLKQGYPTFFSNLSSYSLISASCSISASWCFQKSRS